MLYMYACYFLVVLFHLMIDCMLMLASLRFCLQWVTSSMSQLAALIARRFQCSIVVHTIHGK